MLRAGIIGCGGITERRHGPVLASLKGRVTVTALADLAEERLGLMGGQTRRCVRSPLHRLGADACQ